MQLVEVFFNLAKIKTKAEFSSHIALFFAFNIEHNKFYTMSAMRANN
jgi:hypothetical protein